MKMPHVFSDAVSRKYRNPALVVGHPGHELKLFGWISQCHPLVYVMTDGSGRTGITRLPATEKLLSQLGAGRGEVFGCVTDLEMYQAILARDMAFFKNLLYTMAASFITHRFDFVVGDASEGFNPTHDLCREIVNGAVGMAERETGQTIVNCSVCLTESEQSLEQSHDDHCLHLHLNDDQLRQKIAAAETYVELKDEVRKSVANCGEEYFRIECLRQINGSHFEESESVKPFYEICGEERARDGQYKEVIRFHQHMFPIISALRKEATTAHDYKDFLPTRAVGNL